ncbi:ABC transporter ATP-binding protein [Verminephrobacter aporrectodeae]|uniref:ABC transporter ATP-binding protein n=1 Tax=Verminephrobacter aporrectodeae TaxID=1110389 RepID=UPI002237BF16|nr:ABC transporter ATP-binding protein [Verminephrobacter aporrectodeae]
MERVPHGLSPVQHDLELLDLCKVYPGGHRAVNRLCLQARRGEFISLVGPSGCGKTTTLRMLAGFEALSSGRILLRGRSIGHLPPEQRPTATIFQDFALFPHMTVRENIAFGLHGRLDPAAQRARVEHMLALFELGPVAGRHGRQLSGGQRQRVALARGLAVQPDILLLDEPLGALDANLRRSIQHELKLLQREVGITFLFVTHAQSEALVLSDRVVVMNRGHTEQIDTPCALYTRPATEFVACFIGRNALLAGRVQGIEHHVVQVATALGLLQGTAAGPASLRVGDRALLVVPSEAMDLRQVPQDSAPPAGQIAGHVVGRTYTGQTVRLHVELADGECLTVERHVDHADGLPHAARVLLSWPVAEASVIPAAASG